MYFQKEGENNFACLVQKSSSANGLLPKKDDLRPYWQQIPISKWICTSRLRE